MGWPASPGLWRWREARCRGWHGTHCTEMTPDTGTHNTAGHGKAGGGRGRTAMTVEDTVGGTGARSHLKGRRGVQLKLLIRELRKATRSETKGAR